MILITMLLNNKMFVLFFLQLVLLIVEKAALPYLCQYYFPLKDCTTDNIYTASKEDCVRVSTTVCATPWNIAVNFGHGHRLPKCNTLPHGEHRIVENFAKE